MTEPPIVRRYTVEQAMDEVFQRIETAIRRVELVEIDLVDENGLEFPITFRIQSTDHDSDGSHLIVGVTDLDVIVNLQIGPTGVFANLTTH